MDWNYCNCIIGAYYFGTASKSEITDGYRTVYSVFCVSPVTKLQNCEIKDTATPLNFKVDVKNQHVFRWLDDKLLGENHVLLSNCTIVDNNNWNCNNNGTNLTNQGYVNGVYFENQDAVLNYYHGYLLTVTKAEWESINKRLYPN